MINVPVIAKLQMLKDKWINLCDLMTVLLSIAANKIHLWEKTSAHLYHTAHVPLL